MPHWFQMNRTDWMILLLIYPALFITNYIVFGPPYLAQWPLFWQATLLIHANALLNFALNTLCIKFIQLRLPGVDQFTRRLLASTLGHVFITLPMTGLLFSLYALAQLPYHAPVIPWIMLVGITANIITAGMHEAIFTYQQLRHSRQRELALNQRNLQQQMTVLQQQINPHFLFNSLNSLIALIDENPGQASQFAEELSSVYRYVLRAGEEDLTNLEGELAFIHSYAHLLGTRHGRGFELRIQVDARYGAYQLPPLSLQLLVENAVKHNIVTAGSPLQVQIRTDEWGNLYVVNNLQPKKQRVVSTGVGLSNILAKYELLGGPAPRIREDEGQFVVVLPLLAPA